MCSSPPTASPGWLPPPPPRGTAVRVPAAYSILGSLLMEERDTVAELQLPQAEQQVPHELGEHQLAVCRGRGGCSWAPSPSQRLPSSPFSLGTFLFKTQVGTPSSGSSSSFSSSKEGSMSPIEKRSSAGGKKETTYFCCSFPKSSLRYLALERFLAVYHRAKTLAPSFSSTTLVKWTAFSLTFRARTQISHYTSVVAWYLRIFVALLMFRVEHDPCLDPQWTMVVVGGSCYCPFYCHRRTLASIVTNTAGTIRTAFLSYYFHY